MLLKQQVINPVPSLSLTQDKSHCSHCRRKWRKQAGKYCTKQWNIGHRVLVLLQVSVFFVHRTSFFVSKSNTLCCSLSSISLSQLKDIQGEVVYSQSVTRVIVSFSIFVTGKDTGKEGKLVFCTENKKQEKDTRESKEDKRQKESRDNSIRPLILFPMNLSSSGLLIVD